MTKRTLTITPEAGSQIAAGATVTAGLVARASADAPWRPVAGYAGQSAETGIEASAVVPSSGTVTMSLEPNANITPGNTGWMLKAGGSYRREIGVIEMPDVDSTFSASLLIDTPTPFTALQIPPTIEVGTVEASDPGEDPEVDATQTGAVVTLDWVLPRGEQGPSAFTDFDEESSQFFDLTSLGARHIRCTGAFSYVVPRIPTHDEDPIPLGTEFVISSVLPNTPEIDVDHRDITIGNGTTLTAVAACGSIVVKKVALPDTWDIYAGTEVAQFNPAVFADTGATGGWHAGGVAYQLTNPVNGAEVSSVVPEVGATNFTRTGAAGTGPTYIDAHASYGDRPVWRFDGGDYLDADIPDVAAVGGLHIHALFVAGNFNVTSGNQSLIDGTTGARHLIQMIATARYGTTEGTSVTEGVSAGTGTTAPHGHLLLSTGSSTSQLIVDNTTRIGPTSIGNSALGSIRVGANSTITNFLSNLSCIEFILYWDHMPDAAAQNALWSYLDGLAGYTIP